MCDATKSLGKRVFGRGILWNVVAIGKTSGSRVRSLNASGDREFGVGDHPRVYGIHRKPSNQLPCRFISLMSQRNLHMYKVRSKNTEPELRLRRLIYGMGYRGYRIHYTKLPGKPDVAFLKKRRAIFLHGCFWHGHNCRSGRNVPKSNLDYWIPKLAKNRARDDHNRQELERSGWRVLVIWECELTDQSSVQRRVCGFIGVG